MSPDYESHIIRLFFDFYENGFVYKGLKPVYWCIYDKTALAEAEVEYEMHTSPSVYVKYALTSDPAQIDPALAGKKVNTIIWTTTPWTLPASMAVAFHPDFEYVAFESKGEVYIVVSELAESTQKNCNLTDARVIARFPGHKMEYVTFAHPFLDRKILGVVADYVTTDQGTGAVHTAPSHGADDFYTGGKYKLDQTCNVDEAGRLRNGLPEYDRLQVFRANDKIIDLLKSRGVLLGHGKLEHSYPHCWRCHNPVIFRATEQWFISMEAPLAGSTLRQRSLEEIQKVKWDPAWGEERISNMIATRPDWCISRQRVWGTPIAVFWCDDPSCRSELNDKKVNAAVVNLFAREGADAWHTRQISDILPAGTKCAGCGGTSFRKEMDILDVWFESASSWAAVMPQLRPNDIIADLYTEGGDQHRGWFHSSLLCAVGTRNHAPYRAVATSGWTLDPQGRAMSKSLGNVVDPVDIAKRLGGEIVRLWVASVDFREDVTCSEELMQRVADNYRKIRNTFRNMLANLFDFSVADAVPFGQMNPLDQYMLVRTAKLTEQVRRWYEEFEFHRIYQELHNFCAVDLSAIYFDVLKDRLYTFAPNSRSRRSAQTAIWRIAEAMVRLAAPLMSFTADEVWQFLPKTSERPVSVHLALFPSAKEIYGGEPTADRVKQIEADWTSLMQVRDEGLKALEAARQAKTIGSALDSTLLIKAADPLYSLLKGREIELRALLIVSGVEVAKAESGNGASAVHVEVRRAPGEKCERCWNYSTHVGENKEFPTVCERCTAALSEIVRA
jgi:isoleucyl-tRNA synthetase